MRRGGALLKRRRGVFMKLKLSAGTGLPGRGNIGLASNFARWMTSQTSQRPDLWFPGLTLVRRHAGAEKGAGLYAAAEPEHRKKEQQHRLLFAKGSTVFRERPIVTFLPGTCSDNTSRRFPAIATYLLLRTLEQLVAPPSAGDKNSLKSFESLGHSVLGAQLGQVANTDAVAPSLWDKLGKLCHANLPPSGALVEDYEAAIRSILSVSTSLQSADCELDLAQFKPGVECSVSCSNEDLRKTLPFEVFSRIIGILHLNSFRLPPLVSRSSDCSQVEVGETAAESVHTTALFFVASFINHSCVPNVRIQSREGSNLQADGADGAQAPLVSFVASHDIFDGDELFINYLAVDGTNITNSSEQRDHLLWAYGFVCKCPSCERAA